MSDAAEQIENEVIDGADEAPDIQETPTEIEEKPEDKPEEDENASIARLAFEQREAKRQAREAEERAKALEEQLRAKEQPQRPVVPEKPTDPYADDYEQRMDAWATATAQQRAYDEQVAWEERQAAQQQQAQQQAQWQKQQQKHAEYFARGDKLGISQAEIAAASETINQFHLHTDVIDHLIGDQRGPEMAVYLKNNPAELLKVADMSPMQAGIYLETQIKPKSRREPPKLATPPAETDTGSSVTETVDGITLE